MGRNGLYESLWLQELQDYDGQSVILQKWEVKAFLDKGTFSRIFLVKHYRTGEMAALKFIPNPMEMADCSVWGSPEERFHRMRFDASKKEAEIMDRFHGEKHVVQYLEKPEYLMRSFKNEQGERVIRYAVLICMPLYQNYRKWMPHVYGNRQMSLKLGVDIARALMLFEEKGVYHRDIKPGNILMDRAGDFCLGDVGEAKLESEFTTTGFHGTRPYMAPEVYNLENERGKARSDHRSDIYSLGIILYRLFNHQQFPFLTETGTLTEEATVSYQRYRRVNRLEYDDSYMNDSEKARLLRYDGTNLPQPSEADSQLAGVILKACAYHKEERWQTAGALCHALECCIEGRPIEGESCPEPEESAPAVSHAMESAEDVLRADVLPGQDKINTVKYIYEQSESVKEKPDKTPETDREGGQEEQPKSRMEEESGAASAESGDEVVFGKERGEWINQAFPLMQPAVHAREDAQRERYDDKSREGASVAGSGEQQGEEARNSAGRATENRERREDKKAFRDRTERDQPIFADDQQNDEERPEWSGDAIFSDTEKEEGEASRWRERIVFGDDQQPHEEKSEWSGDKIFSDGEAASEREYGDASANLKKEGWQGALWIILVMAGFVLLIQMLMMDRKPTPTVVQSRYTARPQITAAPKETPKKAAATATPRPANTPLSSVFSCVPNSDGGLTITKYIGPGDEAVIIPERIDGQKVTVIAEDAFENSTITSLRVVGNNLRTIEQNAFWDCDRLKTVVLPEGLKVLSHGSFGYCDVLEEINIPSSVNNMGSFMHGSVNIKKIENKASWISVGDIWITEDADQGNILIGVMGKPVEAVIPNGLEILWHSVFRDQDSLKTVDIPRGVKEIQSWCFGNCSNLEAVMLPETISTIGEYAFAECPKLKTIYGSNATARNLAADLGVTYIEIPVYGARGTHVLSVKNMLKDWGYYTPNASYDDEFNDIMVDRLRMFQKNNGLQQTGRYDMATMKKMTEAKEIFKGQWYQ